MGEGVSVICPLHTQALVPWGFASRDKPVRLWSARTHESAQLSFSFPTFS